ncbi:hypothetical protein MXB_1397 [Myxobolus squamalis]|nr:hypothetical protein MXB_1397 [Myxobolus squamalis]
MSNDLKEAFNFNDRAGNGKISYRELIAALESLGKLFTLSELKEISTEMNKTEFCTVHDKIRKELGNAADLIKRSFQAFDKDGDGFVNSAELRHIMTTLGEKLTEEEANDMIRDADVEGNGRIDYSEFVTRMAQSTA